MVAEEAAQQRCGRPVEATGFDTGEEPASELLGIQWGGGAVEMNVGLAVGGEEEGGSIAGEDQLIEGGELSRLMMISLHSLLVGIYQLDFARRSRLKILGTEVIQG